MPEAHWDSEKAAFKPTFGDHYRELATFKAAEDSIRLNLPPDPNGYKVEVGKSFQVPQGIEFKIDENDPVAPMARQLAHDINQGKVRGQDVMTRMVELHAAGEIARAQKLNEAIEAEKQKLGPTGSSRVTAVQNFLKAQAGEELAAALIANLHTEKQVRAFEKLIQGFVSQGTGNFSHQHREPDAGDRVSDEEYEKMTYGQKRAYSEKFGTRPQANGRS